MSSKTIYWLQCGACGGDSFALLDIDSPNVIELFAYLGIEVLWHPSLSAPRPAERRELIAALLAGEQQLDVLCIEGSVIRGPGGTGMFDTIEAGKPKKDLVAALAQRAQHVVAVGTCASFGGIGTGGEIEATGVQFSRRRRGGFLGQDFVAAGGLPVINLPGCPCHGDVLAGTVMALLSGAPLQLNQHQSPSEWYELLVHQGCVRNEYHEFRIEERDFGEKGCLFFYLGCRGPMARGPCNKLLWNRRSSKTRIGVPCLGCTEPDFPRTYPFFQTRSIVDVPVELPDGVDRAHYLAYKDMAAAAAPDRLKKRLTRV